MERHQFLHPFSQKLVQLMKQKGYGSARSETGVKTKPLAEVCQCSVQMARKYILGEALPNIQTIYQMAQWLNVSPGWLLFGEEGEITAVTTYDKSIRIDSELLTWILVKSAPLFKAIDNAHELVAFIMEVIKDVTHIKADQKDIMKIIELSLNSALQFSEPSDVKRRHLATS